ncbi:hypothetical protein [Hyphomonas sp.]|uniref:hypothetical protein n=1 Tax=Hyphomonas sp. TaxID=87 RepID=UPI000C8B1090|nr:hypothetical protein [Hyphomonas sp.]MAL45880.1 hypothetical protein [Hyphomonas sp.]
MNKLEIFSKVDAKISGNLQNAVDTNTITQQSDKKRTLLVPDSNITRQFTPEILGTKLRGWYRPDGLTGEVINGVSGILRWTNSAGSHSPNLDFVAGTTHAPIIGFDSDVGYTFGSGTAGSGNNVKVMQTRTGDYDLGTDDFAIYMFTRSANITSDVGTLFGTIRKRDYMVNGNPILADERYLDRFYEARIGNVSSGGGGTTRNTLSNIMQVSGTGVDNGNQSVGFDRMGVTPINMSEGYNILGWGRVNSLPFFSINGNVCPKSELVPAAIPGFGDPSTLIKQLNLSSPQTEKSPEQACLFASVQEDPSSLGTDIAFNGYEGKIYEVVIFSAGNLSEQLSLNERFGTRKNSDAADPETSLFSAGGFTEKVEGYLAHKFGKSSLLPSGHPFKEKPPIV